jgi:hypothetical protein
MDVLKNSRSEPAVFVLAMPVMIWFFLIVPGKNFFAIGRASGPKLHHPIPLVQPDWHG